MKFRAHDTFFIRKGWLYKGVKNILLDEAVFIGDTANPMDVLGIGANMVKALRYWLRAVGLTSEPNHGRRVQKLTELGQCIYENDKYIEEAGTLWLLHYKLATNTEEATAWYFFYNEFRLSEFNRDDFIIQLNNYIRINNNEVSERSLEDDFNCIINTYIPKSKSNPVKTHPENNIECPFGELGLLDIVNKKERIYKKSLPKKDIIHPLIVLAIIIEQAKGEKMIKISNLQNEVCNMGKIFNFDIITLINILTQIENLGHIKIVRTAGLDVINIMTDMNFIDCITEYYKAINS